jgi:hypothetical protein
MPGLQLEVLAAAVLGGGVDGAHMRRIVEPVDWVVNASEVAGFAVCIAQGDAAQYPL